MVNSAIFDMDGTLWDAVDSYAEIWNVTAEGFGITKRITRQDLVGNMGLTIDRIFETIFPDGTVREDLFLPKLMEYEHKLMPVLGGKLYPGVKEGIKEISGKIGLYMVSNCGSEGLRNFLRYTGLEPYFKDTLTYGETGFGKKENIRMLIERNNIKNTIYVGDTEGDCTSAHSAGIPMLHVTYGFGTAPDAEYSADNFKEVTELLSILSGK